MYREFTYYFKNLISFLVLLFLTNCLFGQTYNADADISTKELVVKFKLKAFESSDFKIEKGQKVTELEKINGQLKETRKYLSKFDKVIFTKVFTNVEWGDTISVNKKGEKVRINDLSQFYTIKFSKPVKMWKTINELRFLPEIEHADPQIQKVNDIEPDDLHGQGNQWYLPKINAVDAWDISTGINTIKIAIIDGGVDHNHPDLQNKLTGGESTFSGNHGTMVAGVADADILAKMNNFGITQAKLDLGSQLVQEVEAANAAQKKEKGEAQQATVDRDDALDKLNDWVSDFIAIARIALEDKPQLLEKLGIVELS